VTTLLLVSTVRFVGLNEVRRAWTVLGAEDPLWAVRVDPAKRHGGWDEAQFLETGVAEVADRLRWLGDLGLPTRFGSVLDFGCGAGRLTQALARHADEVVGVDVAEPMLATARRMNAQPNCRFVLNDTADLAQFGDGSYDLVFTSLVLQHLPRSLIGCYLGEFLRVLRPGGIALVQLTTRPRWTARGVVWRFAPWPLISAAQTRVLRYPGPMRMTRMPLARVRGIVTDAGGSVVATEPESASSPDWYCTWYAIRR
jgi:SAM-dependent methyltransferase